jgi:tetratricopeptide (TPR) repeat protein
MLAGKTAKHFVGQGSLAKSFVWFLVFVVFSTANSGFTQEPEPADKPEKKPGVSEAEAKIAKQFFQDGRKLFFQSKHNDAIAKFKRAIETNPAKTSYKLLLAKSYQAVQQDAQAIEVFEEIIKANPDHVDAGIELAELLSPQKEPERVIAILEPLLKFKHSYSMYHMLGEAYYRNEDLKKARQYYEEAIKLNARNRTDHYQLGNIYLAQKRFAKSGQAYETAGSLGYSTGAFHFKLASVYFNLRNYLGKATTAQVVGGKAGQISNDLYLIDPVLGKKDTFYVTSPRSAVFQIAKAQKLGIDIFDIQFLEANVWLTAHHYAKADVIYKSLVEKVSKEDAGLLWSLWSQTALGLDDYDNYLARLQKAIDAQPGVYRATMSDALVTVARRYQQTGKHDRFIEYLGLAVESNPLSAGLHLALGDAYWSSNNRKKAIQHYKLVLELEPESSVRVRLLNRIRGLADNAPGTTSSNPVKTTIAVTASVAGKTCLMSGKPANPEFTVAYKGADLFFCCGECRKEFANNLAKLSAKANHQLVLTGQATVTKCPLTGRELNPEFQLKVGNAKVTFCCGGCKGKAAKAKGDKQIELVFNNVAFSKYFKVAPLVKRK